METQKTVVSGPLSVAGVQVIPVSRMSLHHRRRGGTFFILAVSTPLSVIVVTPVGKKAFRMTGEEVSPEELEQECPDPET